MNISDSITRDHAHALLVVVYMNVVLVYLTMKVAGYRKKHNIKYPTLYSKTDDVFNCYQRAHHNTLEWMPIFYSLYVPAAVVYPCLAAAMGFVFATSRIFYAWGYYTGNPENRRWGAWGEIALVVLLVMVVYIALCQLKLMSYT